MTTMTEPTTATIDAPDAALTYDIRRSDSTSEPALFLLGSPMGAGGFATLASHFPDRTIVTYDPRGVERSVKADPATVSTPEHREEQLTDPTPSLASQKPATSAPTPTAPTPTTTTTTTSKPHGKTPTLGF